MKIRIRKKYFTVIFNDYLKHFRIGDGEHNITIREQFDDLIISVQCGYKYYSITF